MGIMNIPYDPRTDPKALFAQGAQNVVGGLLQGRQMRNLAGFAGGMDPEATAMQIVTQALSRGINPQMAMGLGSLQQRGQIGPSQMMAGARWNRYQQARAAGDTDTADRLLSSALVNFNVPLSPEDQAILNRIKMDKATGKAGPGFGPGDKKALGEEMEKRLDNARRGFFGRIGRTDYTEDALFTQWQDFIAANTFDNDNQRENAWALWQGKVNKRGKDWFVDNEVDWEPTDPKWREAIGLTTKKMKLSDFSDPNTKNEFINKLRDLEKVDHELGAEYYNKYLDKFDW